MRDAEFNQSDGQFIVREGFYNQGVPDGWIVTHRDTGLFMWITESSGITVSDAKGMLLKEAEQRCPEGAEQ